MIYVIPKDVVAELRKCKDVDFSTFLEAMNYPIRTMWSTKIYISDYRMASGCLVIKDEEIK